MYLHEKENTVLHGTTELRMSLIGYASAQTTAVIN